MVHQLQSRFQASRAAGPPRTSAASSFRRMPACSLLGRYETTFWRLTASLHAGMALVHRLVQALAAVDHDQQAGFVLQPSLDQLRQEATTDALVLGSPPARSPRALAGPFTPRAMRISSSADSCRQKQRHQVVALQIAAGIRPAAPCLSRIGERPRNGTDRRRAGRPRRPVARGQALQHPQQQPLVHLPRRLQGLIGLQRDLGAAHHIAHPRHLDRQFLIAQVHRPACAPQRRNG